MTKVRRHLSELPMAQIRLSGRNRSLHFMQGSRGFSLIELCIVVAIIAFLVILGFSGVSSMRESANLAKYMGSLHTWGQRHSGLCSRLGKGGAGRCRWGSLS